MEVRTQKHCMSTSLCTMAHESPSTTTLAESLHTWSALDSRPQGRQLCCVSFSATCRICAVLLLALWSRCLRGLACSGPSLMRALLSLGSMGSRGPSSVPWETGVSWGGVGGCRLGHSGCQTVQDQQHRLDPHGHLSQDSKDELLTVHTQAGSKTAKSKSDDTGHTQAGSKQAWIPLLAASKE